MELLICPVCNGEMEIIEDHSYINNGFIDGYVDLKCKICGIEYSPDADFNLGDE